MQIPKQKKEKVRIMKYQRYGITFKICTKASTKTKKKKKICSQQQEAQTEPEKEITIPST